MRFGMCAGLDGIAEVAAAGYDYVESSVGMLVPEGDEAAFAANRKRLAEAPLRVEVLNCFLPGALKVTGPEVDWAAVKRYMTTAVSRAGEVGVEVIVFGSGGSRRFPDGFPIEQAWAQLADAARLAGEIGERAGVTIAMEPLLKRASNLLNRVEEGIAFVDRVRHPRVKLLADLYHVAAEEEPFANIARAGSRLAHIHLATPAIAATGEGVRYDFPGFFAALKQAGYDGRLSVEDNPGLFRSKQPLEPAYRAVLEFVRQTLEA